MTLISQCSSINSSHRIVLEEVMRLVSQPRPLSTLTSWIVTVADRCIYGGRFQVQIPLYYVERKEVPRQRDFLRILGTLPHPFHPLATQVTPSSSNKDHSRRFLAAFSYYSSHMHAMLTAKACSSRSMFCLANVYMSSPPCLCLLSVSSFVSVPLPSSALPPHRRFLSSSPVLLDSILKLLFKILSISPYISISFLSLSLSLSLSLFLFLFLLDERGLPSAVHVCR